ncbi:Uncharacterized protein OS=Rhizobium leguminosarum bv. viciae WSM1455 GN=Rleg5DRAFT_3609 PE=4 SV=1 [Gemmata massiliana]|uniref:2-oxoacid dehydrogenase acyltransferase catalytic domain-containing protein n=1 Tax=Gemmata massiliana TaxID=1210884 RepID=A0A6P2D1P4_9BACT|nr:2-oxo acid dehydrogenase subunit E2 [Gemmata massiliana]VTR94034.1 Uncharacterized protein OS=Rhizobium leguminosarum bv. viciae WSM1455 GN=Rleg5DRAFT_3609 PE=4 SV=1 [Gemmata massiliana]
MRGRVVPLSVPRRLVCDLMHFASGVPTIPVQRRMSLARVVAARNRGPDRAPWTAVFAKALARVAARVPELRRAYCKLPYPHLYEYPRSIASVVVEREYRGQKALFTLGIRDPAERPLEDLVRAVRGAQTLPVGDVSQFRRALRFGRYPLPVRRALWWTALNWGRVRANYFGTFLVSVYSALGAESLHPLSPLTSTLTYGPIGPDGSVDVRLVYDHRVLDGATVARALARLEYELNGYVCDELGTQAVAPSGAVECGSGTSEEMVETR